MRSKHTTTYMGYGIPDDGKLPGERELILIRLGGLHDVPGLTIGVGDVGEFGGEAHSVAVELLHETTAHAKGNVLCAVAGGEGGLEDGAARVVGDTIALDDAHAPEEAVAFSIEVATKGFIGGAIK
jgi:hypothetical protein